MKLIICIFFLICTNLKVSGTSIIIMVLDDGFLVAADGKVVHVNENKEVPSGTTLKIHKRNSIYFAFSGYIGEEGRDLIQMVFDKVKVADIHGSVEALKKQLVDSFEKWIPEMRRKRPKSFAKLKQMTGGWFSFSVFGYSNNKKFLEAVTIDRDSNNIDKCKTLHTVYKYIPQKPLFIYMGEQIAMRKYIKSKPGTLDDWMTDPINDVRKIIEQEIARRPDVVGYPINILLLVDGNRERWYHFPLASTPPAK